MSIIQREDGLNRELDIVAETTDERVILVEVKKKQRKASAEYVEDFHEKVILYQAQHPEAVVLTGFLSLGGFTKDVLSLCQKLGIGWAMELDGSERIVSGSSDGTIRVWAVPE